MERYFFMRAHAVLIGSDVSKLQICYQQIHEFICIFLKKYAQTNKKFCQNYDTL